MGVLETTAQMSRKWIGVHLRRLGPEAERTEAQGLVGPDDAVDVLALGCRPRRAARAAPATRSSLPRAASCLAAPWRAASALRAAPSAAAPPSSALRRRSWPDFAGVTLLLSSPWSVLVSGSLLRGLAARGRIGAHFPTSGGASSNRLISATSASGRHGLVTNASHPASRAPPRAPPAHGRSAPRSGMCRVRSSFFSRRVASQPSMRGSARSIRTMSGSSSLRLLDRLDAVARLRHLEARRTAGRRRTSRARPGSPRRPARAAARASRGAGHRRLAFAGRRSVNVDPLPGVLSSSMRAAENLREPAADRQAQAGAAVAARR